VSVVGAANHHRRASSRSNASGIKVAHRLRQYGAPEPTHYDGLTPAALAAQMVARLGATVDYLPVEAGGAARAAELLAAHF